MERPGEAKEFVVSLEHRIEHLTKRKERCEAYSTMDQSKLNEEQLKAAQNLDEVVGMIREAKHTETAYRTFLARKKIEVEQRMKAEFSRGKAEAAEETKLAKQDGFAQVSTFSRFAAAQYEHGAAGNVRNASSAPEKTASLGVSHQFYLGGAEGAAAMHKLVDGSSEIVNGSGVPYSRSQSLMAAGPPDSAENGDSELRDDNDSESPAESESADSEPEDRPQMPEDAAETRGRAATRESAEVTADSGSLPETKENAEIKENGDLVEPSPERSNGAAPANVAENADDAPYKFNFPGSGPISYAKMAEQGRAAKPEQVSVHRPAASVSSVASAASAAPVAPSVTSSVASVPKMSASISNTAASTSGPGSLQRPSDTSRPASRSPSVQRASPPVPQPSPPPTEDGGFQVVRNDRNKKNRFKNRKPLPPK